LGFSQSWTTVWSSLFIEGVWYYAALLDRYPLLDSQFDFRGNRSSPFFLPVNDASELSGSTIV
jgi:hypothetical protein